MRGRNRKGPNPLTRTYESNGPDVKIRGTAQHIAEKYAQLSRDAQASGDPVAAENYLQHAEHYYRIIAAAQAQAQQTLGGFQRPYDDERDDGEGEDFGPAGYGQQPNVHELGAPQPDMRDDGYGSEGEDEGYAPSEQSFHDRRPERHERQDRQERRDRPQRAERGERVERGDRPERGERPGRSFQERRERFRNGERRPAAAAGGQEGGEAAPQVALPAFLTTPVRVPIAVEPEQPVEPDAPVVAAPEIADAEAGERVVRPRRRRTRMARSDEGAEATADTADASVAAGE